MNAVPVSQGMNAAFEDCEVLTRMIDERISDGAGDWMALLDAYSRQRTPNADAIADMALTNFIENAVSFARSRVDIELDWDARQVRMTITDDGPGFDASVLRSLGEPYVTTRRGTDTEAGLGLGIFIAKTLLERTGARVSFVNTSTGGACVTLRWARADLEADRTGDSHDRGLSG